MGQLQFSRIRITLLFVSFSLALGCNFVLGPDELPIKLRPGERPCPDGRLPARTSENYVGNPKVFDDFWAGSRFKDTQAPGGYGTDENYPKPISSDRAKAAKECYLLAEPDVVMPLHSWYENKRHDFQGMRVVLVNPTQEVAAFDAMDGGIYIIAEALDKSGKWKALDYFPWAPCGNSYHRVIIGPQEYWEFAARRFKGSFATKFRFRYESRGMTTSMVSNEFFGSIDPSLLVIEDPWDDPWRHR